MLLTAPQDETVDTNAETSGRLHETHDSFLRQNCAENRCIWLAMVSSVSPETEHTPAEVLMVSRELPAAPVSDSSLLWRAPEGPEGLAAVPVDGGGAWPGFETTRRAKLAARTASGRAAAHRHTQRPGPQSRTGRVGGRPRRSTAQQAPGYAKGAGTAVPAPHSAIASSRLRPNDPQSWRRRRIHRNMPPTTAAPRPAPPIRPSKPVRARR